MKYLKLIQKYKGNKVALVSGQRNTAKKSQDIRQVVEIETKLVLN